jgi:2-polyprenyl-3-methyl-5-hydroxy-6-metoxy-1,4-benzoquinol methylase
LTAAELRSAARSEERTCWVCGQARLRLVKPANYVGALDSQAFAITDANYGVTAAIYRCQDCGFLQCADLQEVTGFYEGVEDETYEAGRAQRDRQLRQVLERVRPYRPEGRLLDIGAGSGILVSAAQELGYRATGIEPSRWLQRKAVERALPVYAGTFPHPECAGPFDVVTLVDVIEHVTRPVDLLRAVGGALAPGGVAVVVTPDVRSLAARLLGWRWWHYRVAHVGYFDKGTLALAARRAGLELVGLHRAGWFFSGDYLWQRAWKLARLGAPAAPGFLKRMTVPLDLRDSFLAVLRAAGEES